MQRYIVVIHDPKCPSCIQVVDNFKSSIFQDGMSAAQLDDMSPDIQYINSKDSVPANYRLPSFDTVPQVFVMGPSPENHEERVFLDAFDSEDRSPEALLDFVLTGKHGRHQNKKKKKKKKQQNKQKQKNKKHKRENKLALSRRQSRFSSATKKSRKRKTARG